MTGEQIIQTRDSLQENYTPLQNHIRELSVLYTPFENQGDALHVYPWNDSMMFDSTPRQAAGVCVNGLCSLVAPRSEEWFEWEPPPGLKNDDEAVKYYRACSATARDFLDSSNFYEEFHAAVRELVIYGTGNLFCGELDETGSLYYRLIPLGSYYFAENVRGRPTEAYRDLCYTPRQAVEEFGENNLPREIVDKSKGREAHSEPYKFVHSVFRRKDAPDPEDKPNMQGAWMSVTVCEKTKTIVRQETFHEFPFAIGRYERFPGCVWGFGPGSIAKGDSRQLNFLNELADLGTEKSVFPPVEAPASMEGEIGLGALDINYREDQATPGQIHEIGTAANFGVAFQRLQDKRDQVNKAFSVDLFSLFSMQAGQPGDITAYQASLMAGEKLAQFSPIFGRLVSEKLDVILDRLFGTLFRASYFPEPPASVLRTAPGGVVTGIVTPAKRYKNRIVLAMQAKQNQAILEFMQLAAPIAQMGPGAMDVMNIPVTVKSMARNSGVPEEMLRGDKEIEAIQAARAEAIARQQQLEQAESASKTVSNLSKSPDAMNGLRQMAGI